MKTQSLGFIGGGRITRVFLQAFANKKAAFESIVVYDTNTELQITLKKQFSQIKIAETVQEAALQQILIIALHPPMIMETLESIASIVSNDALVISLAPKITIEKISSKLKTASIVRMIPNATSYINQGYNPVTFREGYNKDGKSEVMEMLQLLGNTLEVDEAKLEAYAIISAMLPTYFWFQWHELSEIGIEMGLSKEESITAIQETLVGAINLMFGSGLSAEQVIDLIPVKPIGEHQSQITEIYKSKLMILFEKIRP